MKNFRSLQLAVAFYKSCQSLKLPYHLKDQLNRAASSICLNLAEGSSKTLKDKRRFYRIALASLRESQAVLDLSVPSGPALCREADLLGAHLYKLVKALET